MTSKLIISGLIFSTWIFTSDSALICKTFDTKQGSSETASCENGHIMFIKEAWLVSTYRGCSSEKMMQGINMTMKLKEACDNKTSCLVKRYIDIFLYNLNILMLCDDDVSMMELTTQETTSMPTENIEETTLTEFTENIETTTSTISSEVTENESTENNVTPSNSFTDSSESDISTVRLTEILTTNSTMHTPTRMSGGLATSPMLTVLTGKTSTMSYSIPLETATFPSASTKQISRSTDLTSRRKTTTTRQTTTRLSIPSSPSDTPKPSTQRSTKYSVGTASPEKSSEISNGEQIYMSQTKLLKEDLWQGKNISLITTTLILPSLKIHYIRRNCILLLGQVIKKTQFLRKILHILLIQEGTTAT